MYESYAKPDISGRQSLLDMLCNITSLSPSSLRQVSHARLSSWHRRHSRITFDTARSTFSLEILFTISMNPRCWGGPPLRSIFLTSLSIRLSTQHHSSVSTRLHTLSMGHSVHELAHPRKRRHLNASEASSLYWHIGDACHSLRELGSTPRKRDRSARPPKRGGRVLRMVFVRGGTFFVLISDSAYYYRGQSLYPFGVNTSITNFPSRPKPWGRIRSGPSSPEVLPCILNAWVSSVHFASS